ncbi:lysozyme, partial [Salmonella enterica subsp. enterica]|nr:lysozyme [Salmonella enterica subsp. enterica]
YRAAADQFTRWVYDNDKFVQGLYNRRVAERDLFLS